MEDCIWRLAKEILGIAKGGSERMKEVWWWNKEGKEKVKANREPYISLVGSRTNEEKQVNVVWYRIATNEAKKFDGIAKGNAYERLYQMLEFKK